MGAPRGHVSRSRRRTARRPTPWRNASLSKARSWTYCSSALQRRVGPGPLHDARAFEASRARASPRRFVRTRRRGRKDRYLARAHGNSSLAALGGARAALNQGMTYSVVEQTSVSTFALRRASPIHSASPRLCSCRASRGRARWEGYRALRPPPSTTGRSVRIGTLLDAFRAGGKGCSTAFIRSL